MRTPLDTDAGVIGHLASASMQLISAFQRAEEVEKRGFGPYLQDEKEAFRRNIVAMQEEIERRLASLKEPAEA